MTTIERTRVFLRLEVQDALRSRWLLFVGAVYLFTFGAFVWLGLRESTVLGFTGMSRVVLNLSNALVLTLPLVALVATNQGVVRARSNGFFELMLAQPCARADWLRAAVLSRLVVLVGPIVVLLSGALIYGVGDPSDSALPALVARSLAVAFGLSCAFVGLGFLISTVAKSPERATVLGLLAWLGASMLHDFALIGALLRWKVPPALAFGLAASNPVEAARIAILSSIDPELSVLGPVGFWLANTLGSKLALAIGVGWPLVLGVLAILVAQRRLTRMDLVG
jgi:ABC-2 type transport system permease protein